MPKLSRDSLMTLEAYAKARKDFRTQVIAHKKDRTLAIISRAHEEFIRRR